MNANEIIIDTVEKARAVRNWVRANKVYDASKSTKIMRYRILNCPNKTCADAFRELQKYINTTEAENTDEILEKGAEAALRWKAEARKCPRCVETCQTHEASKVYKTFLREKATMQKVLGIPTDSAAHLVFSGVAKALVS